MSNPRMTGLMLMGVSIAAFLGTTSEQLPSETFFPALILFLIGAFKFLRSNGEAMAEAEKRTKRRMNPTIRENRHAHAHAERLAAKRGASLNALNDRDAEAAAGLASGREAAVAGAREIEIDQSESELELSTDVSFPVDVQRGDALADQLNKLNQLMSQGVLTEEEYAVAKAKLLG